MKRLLVLLGLALGLPVRALDTPAPRQLDLASVLRLAEPGSREVELARERLATARAAQKSARDQTRPTVSPGIAVKAHDDTTQNVEGDLLDTRKYSYAPGVTLSASIEPGENRHRIRAAELEVERAELAVQVAARQALLDAALAYIDLGQARQGEEIAAQTVREAEAYERQVDHAVQAGFALPADALRARAQGDHARLAGTRSWEAKRKASARLAHLLRLDPGQDLLPSQQDWLPLSLVPADQTVATLVASLSSRPDVLQGETLIQAAVAAQEAAVRGPRSPTLTAQAFWGGLGGGSREGDGDFGFQQDYTLALGWKFGPGGLWDAPRREAAASRLRGAGLEQSRLLSLVTEGVVDAHARWVASAERMGIALRMRDQAEELSRLARARKEYGVGVVWEAVQSALDLLRARQEHALAVGDFNRAQYLLRYAAGLPVHPAPLPAKP